MLDHRLRVVAITNNLVDYPECVKDTEEFPNLIEYVEDEMAIFVVDTTNNNFWRADEFFYMVEVTEFLVDSKQLDDDEAEQLEEKPC